MLTIISLSLTMRCIRIQQRRSTWTGTIPCLHCDQEKITSVPLRKNCSTRSTKGRPTTITSHGTSKVKGNASSMNKSEENQRQKKRWGEWRRLQLDWAYTLYLPYPQVQQQNLKVEERRSRWSWCGRGCSKYLHDLMGHKGKLNAPMKRYWSAALFTVCQRHWHCR